MKAPRSMINRIEITPIIPDARAKLKLKQLKSLEISKKIINLWLTDVYTIDKAFSIGKLQKITQLLTNPVIQTASINKSFAPNHFTWAVEIGFLPGVTDNVGSTAKESIEDFFRTQSHTNSGKRLKFSQKEGVYFSQIIYIQGNLSIKEVEILTSSLFNPLIQRANVKSYRQFKKDKGMNAFIPKVKLRKKVEIDKVNLNVSDEELITIGKQGIANKNGGRRGPLSLSLGYMKTIQAYFKKKKRQPTDIELESIAQTWSEHCKHTIFADPVDEIENGLFKTYIKNATEKIRKSKKGKDFCVSVFKDNSGAIIFDENYLITDKVETHNSPSALDPFGGAITGIVGVNRDTIGFGLGAKPIINRYGFCFADPKDKNDLYKGVNFTQKMLSARRIMDGVIEGVNVGGNCSGIPTPQGFVFFDKRYRGKPLVFVGTLGLIPRKINKKDSHKKKASPGDLIVIIGGRVGLDGIHGATFSSEAMDSGSPMGAVQIGDPITQKKLSDAVIKEVRDKNLYTSITDNGAGGLSCSVAEMAKESGGCEVQLEKVPLKYSGLIPWQVWISESQERMTLAIPPKNWVRFKKIMDKHGVEATIIGTFTDSGKCIVSFNQQTIMDVDMDFLHNGLPIRPMRTKKYKIPKFTVNIPEPTDYGRIIFELLTRPNITSYSFISTQYDHEVQGGSVLKPLQGRGRVNADACVVKPVFNSIKGVVLSQGCYPNLSDYDTYQMAASCIDTAIRNAVAAGANIEYLALLDNFCWCSSDKPERLWQLKKATKACYDYATAFQTPFISGKDSMFNDFKGFDKNGKPIKISVPPTLLISSLGVIDDVSKAISIDVKFPGDLIYIIGETHDELTGSEYYAYLSDQEKKRVAGINIPRVNAFQNRKLYKTIYQCIKENLIASAVSVGRGGLAIAMVKKCIAGMLGAKINLESIPGTVSQNDNLLFSESQGRILITVATRNKKRFEKIMADVPKSLIGKVFEKPNLEINTNSNVRLVNINLAKAYQAYHSTYKDY
ncbi:phosphoribosylformylglycinamidine synthase [Candidatus Woesebacteria bacterium RBG_16_34_12]|uniref:Phosphoribosylformylglycinamidine synthase subunit PurL n=1 Tax=Candidatus Woesebacteria bacterium RBG_16_34_12 TaxID=1802480 RepID=A0A1F7XCH6_9BACT|nr:MAG: phosphoribosylformylglycinamidine synthase [Candidatus Woesebacteria bacterium RBG_16_34_12]